MNDACNGADPLPPASDAPAPPRKLTVIDPFAEETFGAASPAQEATPPRGTMACRYCGQATPHHHTPWQIACYERKCLWCEQGREPTPLRQAGDGETVGRYHRIHGHHDGGLYECVRAIIERHPGRYVGDYFDGRITHAVFDSSPAAPTPEATAPEPTDAALLKDLEDSYRADHHFASIADHPAMKWRVDRDVEGAIEPIAARFAQYRAIVAALTADNENLELSRDRWEAEALRLTAERGARAQGQDHQQD